eukprot:6734165-Pyramimonas_sp.AAC.1
MSGLGPPGFSKRGIWAPYGGAAWEGETCSCAPTLWGCIGRFAWLADQTLPFSKPRDHRGTEAATLGHSREEPLGRSTLA